MSYPPPPQYFPSAPPQQPGQPPIYPGGGPGYPGGAPGYPGGTPGMPAPHAPGGIRVVVIRNPFSGLVLDGSDYFVKLQQFYQGNPMQLWRLIPAEAGRFLIECVGKNGLVLDVEGGAECGNNVITYERHGGLNQQWYLNNDCILCADNNLALDISEQRYQPGTEILAYDRHGEPNQQFRIEYIQ